MDSAGLSIYCKAESTTAIRADIARASVSRRRLLAMLFAGVALPVWAEAPTQSPRPKLRATPKPKADIDGAAKSLIKSAKLGGVVGYVVADLTNGRVRESENADVALPPASVCKAVTSLFALETLGVGHRFSTRVMRVGALTDGTIEGDLVLAGGGDPTFDTDKLGDLVAALAASGVRQVTGRFIAYAGALPERDRIAADQPEQVGYNPAISGLMLNFNRVNFEWKRANDEWLIQMNATGERFVPGVKMAKMQVVRREGPLFTYTAGIPSAETALDNWTVAAGALGKDGSRWLPVRHPAIYVAEVFATLCAAQGITLPAAEIVQILPAGAQTIVQHDSEALPELLRKMLKFSTNLTAEAVGLTASGAGTLQGSAATMTDWARRRFGITGTFGDHSGLGPKSQITAADMMQVMIAARRSKTGAALQGLMREMGITGPDGKERKGSKVRVHAKSGTMNFVSNLSGYIAGPASASLAFAIFTADISRRSALSMEAREDPPGGSAWTKRSRRMQAQLIARWAENYL